MKPIPPAPKPTKEEEPKFISICNRDESSVKSKETKQSFALVVKEEVSLTTEISEEIDQSLEESCNNEEFACNCLPPCLQPSKV